MSYSTRALLFRNSLVATVNGLITLMILLIAPLGLAAVITCTLAVTLASFVSGTASDQIFRWLEAGRGGQIVGRQ